MKQRRHLSPPHPGHSIDKAVTAMKRFIENVGDASADGTDTATALGYTTANGASSAMISTMRQYGLLVRTDEGYKATALAFAAVDAGNPAGAAEAVAAAAWTPVVFKDIKEAVTPHGATANRIIAYLMGRGYRLEAARRTASAYLSVASTVEDGGAAGPRTAEPAVRNGLPVAAWTETASLDPSASLLHREPGMYVDIRSAPDRLGDLIVLLQQWMARQSPRTADGTGAGQAVPREKEP